MPNWCQNELQIFGPSEDLQRFKTAAVGGNTWPTAEPSDKEQPSVLSFHSLDPIPAEVLAADYNQVGHPWELAHWGCRWGSGDAVLVDESDDWLLYHFDTPWSQPVPFLKRLVPICFQDETYGASHVECRDMLDLRRGWFHLP